MLCPAFLVFSDGQDGRHGGCGRGLRRCDLIGSKRERLFPAIRESLPGAGIFVAVLNLPSLKKMRTGLDSTLGLPAPSYVSSACSPRLQRWLTPLQAPGWRRASAVHAGRRSALLPPTTRRRAGESVPPYSARPFAFTRCSKRVSNSRLAESSRIPAFPGIFPPRKEA